MGNASITDRADDEDLSQSYSPIPLHSAPFEEQISWADPLPKPHIPHHWEDPFLFGDPTSLSPPTLGVDPDMVLGYGDPNDSPWSDPHDLSLDSTDDHDSDDYQLTLAGNVGVPAPMDVDLQDDEYPIPSTIFESSDDDLLDPFQLDLPACLDFDQDDAESEIQPLHDHVSSLDGHEENSGVMAEHELASHPGTLSQSPSFSITVPTSYQTSDISSQENSSLPLTQLQLPPLCEEIPAQFPIDTALYHFIDVGIDDDMLSDADTDSIGTYSMETASEEYCDLEEFEDRRGDLVPHLGLLGEAHPAATLFVTCSSAKYEHQESREYQEPRELRPTQPFESDLDGGGVSAATEARKLFAIEDWGEEALLVVDF